MPMLQENPPDLAALYGVGPLSGYLGGQQLDRARKSQDINQAGALQEMFIKPQREQVEMDYKSALTGQTNQQTRASIMKNDMDEATWNDRYKSELSKIAKETSDNDLAMQRSQIEQLALHDDPKTREIGKYLMGFFKEVEVERLRQKGMTDRQIELEELRGKNQRTAAAAKASATKPMTMQQYEAMLRQKASEGDETAMQALAQLEEDKRAKAAAGANVTDTRVREMLDQPGTKPDGSSTGKVKSPTSNIDYSKWTMEQWKQRYPNTPEAQLREALKAKGYSPK